MSGEIEDWDTVFAAFDLLNREGGARSADCEWMRLGCDARRVAVDVFVDKTETHRVDGVEEEKYLKVDFWRYGEEGNGVIYCLEVLLPPGVDKGRFRDGVMHGHFL